MDDAKVAVILEDLRSQFKVFGEGLQLLSEKADKIDDKVNVLDKKVDSLEIHAMSFVEKLERHILENTDQHHLMMQMIKELSDEQLKLKRAK